MPYPVAAARGKIAQVVPIILELQPAAAAGLDTWLWQVNPTWNEGVGIQLVVGDDGTLGGTVIRSLLKFSGLSAIPATAIILSATLQLYCESEADASNRVIGAHRALTQWYEGNQAGAVLPGGVDGSTWNLRNANGALVWAGGAGGGAGSDYTALATATVTITAPLAWYSWNVAADVRAFVSGLAANYGWWLVGVDEAVAGSRKRFASSDSVTATSRPKLTVVYY